MRLGIVRHFRVIDSTGKRWVNAQEFNEWVEHYEQCDIETNDSHPLSQWDACYSSDQQRALKTAAYLFEGEVIKTKLLREIGISSVFRTSLKLPRLTWLMLGRIGCLFHHPSQEGMRAVMVRAKSLVDLIEAEQDKNVLIVSHGAFMKVLKIELNRRGYKGERFHTPINGRIYLFDKKE